MAKIEHDLGKVYSFIDGTNSDPTLGRFLATEAARGMTPYVPMFTGILAASATVEPFAVTYNTPYARYVYYGDRMRISKERHPLASTHWDRPYLAAHLEDLCRAGTNYLKQRH
nr:MAG TPA: Minor capsid protein [Caudoviricetes sp.]